ncbi:MULTISPECIES: 3-methyl-2-oxobutanoate dehydrogenase subunit VorB [Acetomicrobium]|uniref:3-methyl-2-oxobutanoate dehydrogenase subunit VorB n=1 Tax=Acetomicrobium TaxID=49894 RepID=UPI0026EB0F79|nr:3-methyl-2-oxobutanoate dehydrogenase subunit VorB [Acetomicrobium mobile]MDI9377899.1 3-methyl-2-oxobutanoate dehydrogenase subunit VorB [Synergistota bacterium]HPT64425.1 3-methyl-2-oxobutanoate dehydrogenase subunit VorB [Acetomicrobium sp.]HQA36088.1 3-methyl-2-oxobutanoate dehydrogenase subunit VorB [Acetomicrobium sp.]HQC87416.1 3-methyl-2-oxobutanoate dehydrogenase subunit VorB [Acetomicrobium sp.]HXK98574.1 3-methyl-2-oxobutanoate dehydrogenase subunit VorB [Acetomicrobium sp.]
MSNRVLMKGNEAFAEAAVQAGCKYFFGYPITPQNEIPEYMSKRLPEVGGVYLQAESEVAGINMIFGAAGTGFRTLISSSSPGISLMSEGISYIAAAELPCVIINVMRGGPGLGGILPAQSDYFQATKGGGHGDYRLLVLAPGSLQEATEFIMMAFDLTEFYRNPVMILTDGFMGQMMEAVEFKKVKLGYDIPDVKEWAVGYMAQRGKRTLLKSLSLDPEVLEQHNQKLQKKYRLMEEKEVRFESANVDDAEIVIAAYGTTARIAKSAVKKLRDQGIKAGIIRPQSLYPFPYKPFSELPESVKHVLVVEMSCGQMVEDVELGVSRKVPVSFYGRCGGMAPSVEEIEQAAKKALG